MGEKIDVLCENYDKMTDEGREELLKTGEKYLNESEKEKTDELKLKNKNFRC
jgi:hypothetical protein